MTTQRMEHMRKYFHQYVKNASRFACDGVGISDLLGKTFVDCFRDEDRIVLIEASGNFILMQHFQSCCESVYLDSVVGDLSDLIGSPILKAEESINPSHHKDQTWSFYKLATIKGYVDMRWIGSSNGYYSETIGIYSIQKEEFVPHWH